MLDAIFHGGAEIAMNVDPTWAWIALFLQPFFYFALYLYFDNIIPNAFGISKDCCYCFRRRQ